MFQDGSNETLHLGLSGISSVTQKVEKICVFLFLKEKRKPASFPVFAWRQRNTLPQSRAWYHRVRLGGPFLFFSLPPFKGKKKKKMEKSLFPSGFVPRRRTGLMLTRLKPATSNALLPFLKAQKNKGERVRKKKFFSSLSPLSSSGRKGKWKNAKCHRKQTFLKTSHLVRFPLNNFKFFELSFQSSLQLSLAVLVCYRSFAGIFSLGWNLPPVLGLHSQTTRLEESIFFFLEKKKSGNTVPPQLIQHQKSSRGRGKKVFLFPFFFRQTGF